MKEPMITLNFTSEEIHSLQHSLEEAEQWLDELLGIYHHMKDERLEEVYNAKQYIKESHKMLSKNKNKELVKMIEKK